jgi:hypothetical protein
LLIVERVLADIGAATVPELGVVGLQAQPTQRTRQPIVELLIGDFKADDVPPEGEAGALGGAPATYLARFDPAAVRFALGAGFAFAILASFDPKGGPIAGSS